LLAAQWGGAVLRAFFLPPDFAGSVLTDHRTLLLTGVTTVGAALLTGVAPAVDAARSSLSPSLTAAGRDTGLRSSPARAGLLVFQASLSVVLLVGAGLFVRSLQHVRALRLGFDVDPIVVVTDNSRGVEETKLEQLALENRLVETARSIPGVTGASIVSSIPFWGFEGQNLFVPGIDSVDLLGNFDLQAANPAYFRTMGTRLLRGRAFDDRDNATAPRVVVVSLGMASALWPGREPLGQCIRIKSADAPCATVIGVTEDLHLHTLTNRREYMYYVPIAQHGEPEGMLVVRVAGQSTDYVEIVRRRLQQEMPGKSYVTAEPFSDIVEPQMRAWQLGATMFVAFGTLALALAAIGLYSVIAYAVAQRRREIGVRMALGATRGRMVRLILHDGVRLVVLGVALGLVLALVASRAMAKLLFQEPATDPFVYVAVVGVLVAVAILATTLPALAAGRVDPNVVLRAE
jgi:predicted permease